MEGLGEEAEYLKHHRSKVNALMSPDSGAAGEARDLDSEHLEEAGQAGRADFAIAA